MRTTTKHIGNPAALTNRPVVGILQDRAGIFKLSQSAKEFRATSTSDVYTGMSHELSLLWILLAKVCKIFASLYSTVTDDMKVRHYLLFTLRLVKFARSF